MTSFTRLRITQILFDQCQQFCPLNAEEKSETFRVRMSDRTWMRKCILFVDLHRPADEFGGNARNSRTSVDISLNETKRKHIDEETLYPPDR